jgi:hypothetical protein
MTIQSEILESNIIKSWKKEKEIYGRCCNGRFFVEEIALILWMEDYEQRNIGVSCFVSSVSSKGDMAILVPFLYYQLVTIPSNDEKLIVCTTASLN